MNEKTSNIDNITSLIKKLDSGELVLNKRICDF